MTNYIIDRKESNNMQHITIKYNNNNNNDDERREEREKNLDSKKTFFVF